MSEKYLIIPPDLFNEIDGTAFGAASPPTLPGFSTTLHFGPRETIEVTGIDGTRYRLAEGEEVADAWFQREGEGPIPLVSIEAAEQRIAALHAENAQALADLAAQPPGDLTPEQEAAAVEHAQQRAKADLTKPDRDFTAG